MTGPEAFGLELRRARERKGLTLDQVSQSTKVSVAHFAGLERGDVSRWPAGIFGRAFVRGYAVAVGLDPETAVAAFAQVYPESPDGHRLAPRPHPAPKAADRVDLPEVELHAETENSVFRLVLDPTVAPARPGRAEEAALRVAAGLVDVLLPLAVAGAAAFVAGRAWFWMTAACVGALGHLAFFGFTGSTPGQWLSRRRRGAAATVFLAPASRRRQETEAALPGRRRVSRHQSMRPSAHAHRTHH